MLYAVNARFPLGNFQQFRQAETCVLIHFLNFVLAGEHHMLSKMQVHVFSGQQNVRCEISILTLLL